MEEEAAGGARTFELSSARQHRAHLRSLLVAAHGPALGGHPRCARARRSGDVDISQQTSDVRRMRQASTLIGHINRPGTQADRSVAVEIDEGEGETAWLMPAGSFRVLTAEDSWRLLGDDLDVAVRAAQAFPLHPSCRPGPELTEYLRRVLASRGGAGPGQRPRGEKPHDWRCLMNKRIGLSYRLRSEDLVWLDDKQAQVSRTSEIFNGRTLHLPLLGQALEGDAVGLQELQRTVAELVASDRPCVVKPSHGSNSKLVSVWPSPWAAGQDCVWDSVLAAASSHDPSWKKESWNQNAVPRGVIIQPLYNSITPGSTAQSEGSEGCTAAGNGISCAKSAPRRPLELKVQVLFGKVVGACLHTHPQALWVCRRGVVHLWDHRRPGLLKKKRGWAEPLPQGLQTLLCTQLHRHWQDILGESEHLATTVGLDELRVDWLLGDPIWGPRVGELTFMGTMALDLVPVSQSLAGAYALGHLNRIDSARLQPAEHQTKEG